MKSSAPPDAATARLLQSYTQQHGLSTEKHSLLTPVDMTVDSKYRLRLRALPQGGIAIVSRLRTLPDADLARDELVLHTSRLAVGMMREHASTCVIDESQRALWLQQTLNPNSIQEIDEAVGCFVNALAFWSQAVNKH